MEVGVGDFDDIRVQELGCGFLDGLDGVVLLGGGGGTVMVVVGMGVGGYILKVGKASMLSSLQSLGYSSQSTAPTRKTPLYSSTQVLIWETKSRDLPSV